MRRWVSVSKKSFLPPASFQNFIKVLKTKDFNGAGHPSWVSRAHPSFPLRRIYLFIDSLNRGRTLVRPAWLYIQLLLEHFSASMASTSISARRASAGFTTSIT